MTLFELAERFVGEVKELPGKDSHPFIQWCHLMSGLGNNAEDEVPWCSSFLNVLAWLLRLPRSKSAAARSWLAVGRIVELHEAKPGYDVVIFKRGTGVQPGPNVLHAPGHVAVFAGLDGSMVHVIGGNQSNGVTRGVFDVTQVLGVRRLKE